VAHHGLPLVGLESHTRVELGPSGTPEGLAIGRLHHHAALSAARTAREAVELDALDVPVTPLVPIAESFYRVPLRWTYLRGRDAAPPVHPPLDAERKEREMCQLPELTAARLRQKKPALAAPTPRKDRNPTLARVRARGGGLARPKPPPQRPLPNDDTAFRRGLVGHARGGISPREQSCKGLCLSAMFVGHVGMAFAAKRLAPETSLGSLILAAELVDLVWPVLVLIGAEHVAIAPGATKLVPLALVDYPITHSLVGGVAWALLLGLSYLRFTRYRRGAWVVGALVLSHWALDVLSHRPDMPVLFSGPYVGLGLWNHVAAAVGVESLIFAFGVVVYFRSTMAYDGIGRWGSIGFVLLLAALQLANWFGPPPPSARAVAWTALTMWLFVPLCAWLDAHREPSFSIAPGPARAKTRGASPGKDS
jgi:hypothetical protein